MARLRSIRLKNKDTGKSYTLWGISTTGGPYGTKVYDDEISAEETLQGQLFLGALLTSGKVEAEKVCGDIEIVEIEIYCHRYDYYKAYLEDGRKIIKVEYNQKEANEEKMARCALLVGGFLVLGKKGLKLFD